MAPTPAELIALGVQANAAGRPEESARVLSEAVQHLDRPRAGAPDRMLLARALIALAIPTFESAGLNAALARLEEARRAPTKHDAPVIAALSTVQEAGLLARAGRWSEAIERLTAIDADLHLLSAREHAVAVLNRGMARQSVADLAGSRADLQQARRVAEQGGVHDIASMAVQNLGCLALLEGDTPAAIAAMNEADAMDAGTSTSTVKLDLGRAYIEAGLLDEARTTLWAGLHIATKDRLNLTRAEILVELAREAVLSAAPQRAAKYAGEAASLFERFGAASWRHHAEILGAQAALLSGDLAGFQTLSRQVAAHVSDSPTLQHDAALVAAERALVAGDTAAADQALAFARAHRRVVLTSWLHRDLLDAMIGDSRGEPRRRRRALHRASNRLVRASARYSGLDSRTAIALHAGRLADLDLSTALASGRVGAVYGATERWRALTARLPRLQPVDDERLRQLAGQLRQIHAQLDDLDDITDDAELRSAAVGLERAIAERERELSGQLARGRDITDLTAYPTFRRLVTERDAHCVAFFVHRGRLLALTVNADRRQVHDLAAEREARDLSSRLAADLRVLSVAPGPMRAVVEGSIQRQVGALNALLGPALTSRAGRVAVVPSTVLPSVPWRMLPSLAGRPLVVSPSLTVWSQPAAPLTTICMTAIAGPAVARAGAEAAATAQAWRGGTTYTGHAATVARLTDLLRDCDIVHIAAHGTHHDESPLFSSVHLDDGPAFAYEFQRIGVGARHVVLSSCSVGQSQFRTGDEALGLTASLLACGVRNVVAAVAPVRDESAVALMTAYHRELAQGLDVATALEVASEGVPDARLFAAYGADWSARA